MIIKPNRNKLKAREEALVSSITRDFNKYKKEFVAFVETLDYAKKSITEEIINIVVRTIGENIITEINKQSLRVYQEQQAFGEKELGLELGFDLKNKQAEQYIKDRQSTLIKINTNTQRRIQQLLLEVVRGETLLNDMVTKINQSFFLDRKRAELIATNELGTAFVEGTQRTIKTLAVQNGIKYMKRWDSVGDSNVTTGCRHNDQLGWVAENYDYPNTDGLGGGEQPPRFIGCRCTLIYDVEN